MHRVPTKDIGQGMFILSNTYVRPRVTANPAQPALFHRNQNLNFWMQVYNLGLDEKSKQNNATIDYQIVNTATNQAILSTTEESQKLGASSDQLTLEKTLPLASVEPGKYMVKISVDDDVTHQQIAESAPFTVE
jgi:hypothetical protein